MTVSNIKVKNFQSILNGEVDLGKFTVFTGPSSSGKSAFVRAAHAVMRNSFNPSQVTVGHKVSEVSVVVDGKVVTAIRGKSKSTYKLDDVEYTKAGRNVPDSIVEVLAIPEISDIDTTFSYQFDKPYLLSEPGSVASKVLGSLTNVSVLHDSLRESNRRNREIGSRLKVKSVDLENVTTRLEEYSTLPEALESLGSAKNDMNYLLTRAEKVTSLESVMSSVRDGLLRLESLKRDLALAGSVEEVTTELTNLSETSLSSVGKLNSLLVDIDLLEINRPKGNFEILPKVDVEETLNRLKTITDSLDNIKTLSKTSLPDYSGLSNIDAGSVQEELNSVTTIGEALTQLSLLIKKKADTANSINTYNTKICELQAEYDTLLEGIEVCPLCFTALNH